ncbi:MAG: hypothetical protein HMLKMBBP_00295 [Planctomycetes bacterium]|nr:hypothetical protein [Planctomycetota bacterium]
MRAHSVRPSPGGAVLPLPYPSRTPRGASLQAETHATAHASSDARAQIRFREHSPFWNELTRRVDAHFAGSGRAQTGGVRMVVKTLAIFAWLGASYFALVWYASGWETAVPLAISLSLAVAGVGFNVQHDGGHDAYAKSKFWNRVTAASLDLVGGSSYVWRWKHSIMHHTFTNVDGHDEDIDSAPFLRLAPGQRRRSFHRFQHWYAWLLFGFLPGKWAYWDDFSAVIRGKVGKRPIPRPRGRDLAVLIAGKLAYTGWVFVVPVAAGHSVGLVLGMYAFCSLVTGVTLAVVFQSAHCVVEAEFPAAGEGGRLERGFGEHQLATTMDFAPNNPFLTWYLGGLTHQVEHHLFPRISHVHYPDLAPIVKRTCDEYGIEHRTHPSFRAAIASHVRHLRRLGAPA